MNQDPFTGAWSETAAETLAEQRIQEYPGPAGNSTILSHLTDFGNQTWLVGEIPPLNGTMNQWIQ